MTRTNRTLAAAIGLSVALHFAALLGTPRFDFDWRRYEAPAPLELTILTQPPVEIAPEPVRRRVGKPDAPKKRAVPVADVATTTGAAARCVAQPDRCAVARR